MKKLLSILFATVLAFSFTACTAKDYSNSTVTGKITKIDGQTVTMKLGELSQSQPGGDGQTPPEKPSDENENQSQQTPPEKPSGESDSSSSSDKSSSENQTPPSLSENGSAPSGQTPPGAASNFEEGKQSLTLDFENAEISKNGQTITVDDLSVGDILTVELGDNETVKTASVQSTQPQGQGGAPDGQGASSGEVTQGSAATTIDQDGSFESKTYTSSGDDENALRVDSAKVSLDSVTVEKSSGSSSNTENGDFYGVNAALLATNGATLTVKNATVSSSAQNGNGVFSYGSGTTVNISDSTIKTTKDNSGGLQTTGGATMNAENLTVETSGNSSAAIRSDRGGGTVSVEKGSYTSNGLNSPAVYSTADITVKNATLTANNSEALVIEGKNSITLENCDTTGNMSDTEGSSSSENVHNVMIYQSMSGDADEGTSVCKISGGSLTAQNGDMFYVTNTKCVLTLSGVDIENKDSDGYLLRAVGNSASHGWGTAGSNGAQVEFTADSQALDGNIVVDSISTLSLTLKNGSVLNGSINIVDNAEGGTAVSDNAVVTIESGCTWNVTEDCTITTLVNNGTVNFNGHTVTLADGTVLS